VSAVALFVHTQQILAVFQSQVLNAVPEFVEPETAHDFQPRAQAQFRAVGGFDRPFGHPARQPPIECEDRLVARRNGFC